MNKPKEEKEKAIEIQSFIDFLNELRNKLKYVSDIKFMKKLITYLNTTHDCEKKIKIEKNLQLEQFYRNEKLQKENTELKEKIRKMEELKKMNVFEYIHSKDKIKRRKSYFQKLL